MLGKVFVSGMGATGKTQGAWLLPLEEISASVQENNPTQIMSCYSPVVKHGTAQGTSTKNVPCLLKRSVRPAIKVLYPVSSQMYHSKSPRCCLTLHSSLHLPCVILVEVLLGTSASSMPVSCAKRDV